MYLTVTSHGKRKLVPAKNPGCWFSDNPKLWLYNELAPKQTSDQLGNCGKRLFGDVVTNIPGKYSVVLGCRTKFLSLISDLSSVISKTISLSCELAFICWGARLNTDFDGPRMSPLSCDKSVNLSEFCCSWDLGCIFTVVCPEVNKFAALKVKIEIFLFETQSKLIRYYLYSSVDGWNTGNLYLSKLPHTHSCAILL